MCIHMHHNFLTKIYFQEAIEAAASGQSTRHFEEAVTDNI